MYYVYGVAQICKNGHVIDSYDGDASEHNQTFCTKCGERTISRCENCSTPIRGSYKTRRVDLVIPYSRPSYCHACGQPYPWVEKKLRALEEALQLNEQLTVEEKQELLKDTKDIIANNPRTEVAVERIKRLLNKIGKGASDILYKLIIDIASETAKRMLKEQ